MSCRNQMYHEDITVIILKGSLFYSCSHVHIMRLNLYLQQLWKIPDTNHRKYGDILSCLWDDPNHHIWHEFSIRIQKIIVLRLLIKPQWQLNGIILTVSLYRKGKIFENCFYQHYWMQIIEWTRFKIRSLSQNYP